MAVGEDLVKVRGGEQDSGTLAASFQEVLPNLPGPPKIESPRGMLEQEESQPNRDEREEETLLVAAGESPRWGGWLGLDAEAPDRILRRERRRALAVSRKGQTEVVREAQLREEA